MKANAVGWAIFSWVGLLASCQSSSDDAASDSAFVPAPDGEAESCHSDADCEPGLRCERTLSGVSGRRLQIPMDPCMGTPVCHSDVDCGEGSVCEEMDATPQPTGIECTRPQCKAACGPGSRECGPTESCGEDGHC